MCFRMNRPATSRVGRPGCLDPVWHTEPKLPFSVLQSIGAAKLHQWVGDVDDLIQRRKQQAFLTTIPRFAHRLPNVDRAAVRELRIAQKQNPKTQESGTRGRWFEPTQLYHRCGLLRVPSNVLIEPMYLRRLKYKRHYKWHCGWSVWFELKVAPSLLARVSPLMSAMSLKSERAGPPNQDPVSLERLI